MFLEKEGELIDKIPSDPKERLIRETLSDPN